MDAPDTLLSDRPEKRGLFTRRIWQAMRLHAQAALQPVLDAAQQPVGRAQFPELRIANVPFIVQLLQSK
jgi:hypothetical protein